MDLFLSSEQSPSSSSHANLTSTGNFSLPESLLSELRIEDNNEHNDFVHFLQQAQALQVRILPLVYESRLDRVRQERFSFKRFKPDPGNSGYSERQLRRLQYKAATNEMAILSCSAIRDHPNITLFVGVGFEVIPSPVSVRPVLVFSKATAGGLDSFVTDNQNQIDDDVLLGICGEVAKGLDALHSSNIVHGDIKPANVLVWRQFEPEPSLAVALTDFGFSSFTTSGDEPVQLVSGTKPWDAPEWTNGEHSISSAKKMDLYSFGLLCFWHFFRNETLGELGIPETTVDSAFCRPDSEKTVDVIQYVKKTGDSMLQWAMKLLERREMETKIRECLKQVFGSTLTYDPESRKGSWMAIVKLLSEATGQEEPSKPVEPGTVNVPDEHGSLEVENLFFDLEACDYRIHSFLADGLVHIADAGGCQPCAQNASFQLALCYALGFGVTRDESECERWLARSGRCADDLAGVLERIKNAEPGPQASSVANLASMGYRNDLVTQYLGEDILETAINEYRSMLQARSEALGLTHFSTSRVMDTLAHLLSLNYDEDEALELALENVENSEGLGPDDLRRAKYTAARLYMDTGEADKSEQVLKETLSSLETIQDGEARTEWLDYKILQADILLEKGRFKKATALSEEVVKESTDELGHEHPSTLSATRTLVQSYMQAGNNAMALEASEKLVAVQQLLATRHNPSPRFTGDVALLGVLRFVTGNTNGALDCYHDVQRWIEYDIKRALSATSMVNNFALALIKLEKMDEAQEVLEALLKECDKELGEDSAESAMVAGNLAMIYHEREDWEKAEPMEKRVFEARRENLGLSHPETITSLGHYLESLLATGKTTEAVQTAEEGLSGIKTAAEATLNSIMTGILTISGAFETAKSFKEAILFLEKTKEVIATAEAEGEPLRGVLTAPAMEARCYLGLQEEDKAREIIYHMLMRFTIPFLEYINKFLPELLRLAEMCLERGGFTMEAEQMLIGAKLLCEKSQVQVVEPEVLARVKDAVSRHFKLEELEERGAEEPPMIFNPQLLQNGEELGVAGEVTSV
ncbi:hypothetical protein QBC38DRAFT_455500 [Podospora fimiseda]|uniref:Protein kinase domain-containing protein n=1 Tax=Podospora fimiseda TaxID=252190 RepID=A0AAN7BPF8_9PEZI|nr:hypothetical protein QBC38DRAFT_455500 [Podospora fimiseda]